MIEVKQLIFCLLLISGCNHDDLSVGPTPDVPDTPVEETPFFEVIWANRMQPDRYVLGSDNTFIYNDWYIKGGDEDIPTVYFFDKNTGNKSWTYSHQGAVDGKIYLMQKKDNILIGVSVRGLIALDLETQSLLWEINYKINNHHTTEPVAFYEGYAYQPITYIQSGVSGINHINKINLLTGEDEIIFTSNPITDNGPIVYPDFGPVTFHEDLATGKKSILFNCGWYNGSATDYPQDLYSIDLESQALNWKTRISGNATNLLHAPVIYQNMVITGGGWSMFGLNAITGEQEWKYSFSQYEPWGIFNKTNHLIENNRLFVNNGQNDVTCLNPNTGMVIWNNPEGGANCTDNMVYYKDMLVFTSWGYGSVMVLDALSGETVHRENGLADSEYNNDVAYDEETDMFFTSTYWHAVGFKINRPD